MNLQNLRKQITQLANKAVVLGEGSHSIHENLATGPKYQQIEIGGTYAAFRDETRYKFLDQIPHQNARVLDIGSNLGVTARRIASLGASKVIGIEYDPYFITIANLVNTAEGIENVRFVEGDARKSEVYSGLGLFEVVYSLSSFNYSQYAIDKIAGICLDYFVVETHRALPGVFRKYYDIIGQYFPAYKIMGFTDHGRGSPDHRLFIIFARSANSLEDFSGYDDHFTKFRAELDLQKTKFSYLEPFFAVHDPGNCLWKKGDDPEKGIKGVMYWEKLLEGYNYWLDNKDWKQNPYYLHLVTLKDFEYPGGSILNTRADHEYIINRRLGTFHRAKDRPPEYPIKMRVQKGSRGSGVHHLRNYGMYQIAEADGIQASFDGIHRCFMYKYLGYTFIPAHVTLVP